MSCKGAGTHWENVSLQEQNESQTSKETLDCRHKMSKRTQASSLSNIIEHNSEYKRIFSPFIILQNG